MTASRLTAWTLLAAAVLALLPRPAAGQDSALPTKPPEDVISAARDARGYPKEALKQVREGLAAFAKYYADTVTNPLIYRAPLDNSLKTDAAGNKYDAGGRLIPTPDFLIRELEQRYLADPTPANAAKWTADKADYIRELGAAFDAALKPVVETHQDRIVRINAARLYAAVCRTGAAAHWPTVTDWLTNANTPTEIKHYALQAAANLLSAYDVNDYSTRRHAFPLVNQDNVAQPRLRANKVIGALVAAVDACVRDPNALVPLPGGKLENASPEQLAVAGFVRRNAIRALAQVRFVSLPGPDGQTPIFPVHTLARVCLSDPALVPAPTPADCAEAVIGVCNMAPMVESKAGTAFVPLKAYNPAAAAEAVAAGLLTFATPRTDPTNRSLPWQGYSARLGDALRNWGPLFNPAFDPTRAAATAGTPPQVVSDLAQRAQTAVLAPIDKGGLASRVDIESMRAFLKQLQGNPKRPVELVEGEPATRLPVPAKK